MSETSSDLEAGPASAPEPSQPEPAAAGSSRSPSLWPWVLLLTLIAAAGWWLWQAQQRLQLAERSGAAWQDAMAEVSARQAELDRALQALQDRQRTIDSRLQDTASNQRVLRDEMLGIGERAALLEDALARLAQTRQEGAQAMLLDEAEFLLLTGAERLQLFRDHAAAARALTLADAALAGLQEPIYAPLRQTLAQELDALRAMPADPAPVARSRIHALLADLPRLPPPPDSGSDTARSDSRLLNLLGQLVTVRRLDDGGAPLDPTIRAARMAAFALRLQLLLAAIERDQWSDGDRQLAAARSELEQLFDRRDPRVAAHAAALSNLTPPASVALPELGATLRELRALRATRRLGELAPVPATPPVQPREPAAPRPAPLLEPETRSPLPASDEAEVEASTDSDRLDIE